MKIVSVLVAALVLVLGVPPANAAPRVSVSNANGDAVIDPTYATTITVRGRGFQSIKNGHGGIYVLFGVVKGAWKPSAGGKSGANYLSVPDSESKNNAGYARFVAFPGSDTAGSANGGTIAANGTWSTKLAVPGAVFTTTDNTGKAVRVDCRVSTCGVITIGAHGVANAHNESFTRVRVGKVAAAEQAPSETTTAPLVQEGGQPTPLVEEGGQRPSRNPALEVDRASAKPGRVLAFSAVGLDPGNQVSATFDNGAAAVGPMTVGANGQVAGVLTLPTDLRSGTYELRIVGGEDQPSVRFAVVAPEVADAESGTDRWALVFAISSGVVLAAAIAFGVRHRLRGRRAA